MAAEILADEDHAERVKPGDAAAGEEERGVEEEGGARERQDDHRQRGGQRRDAERHLPPEPVRHPAEREDEERLAERKDRDQRRRPGIGQPMRQTVERKEALQRRLADAGEEGRGDHRAGERQRSPEPAGLGSFLFAVAGGDLAVGAHGEGEHGTDGERNHRHDERQRSDRAGEAEHHRSDELADRVERARSADDAAAVLVVDDAVQPYLGRRPQRREAHAHEEAPGEPDRDPAQCEDRAERGERPGEEEPDEEVDAEFADQSRQERPEDEDAGAGDRGVEADQPGRQRLFLEGEREERVGVAVEDRLGAD